MAFPFPNHPIHPAPSAHRDRYLPAMTARRIASLPDKDWAPVILATGAVEQHGPQLPVAVDALMGQAWLDLALARLPAGASCYVAPPVTIGKSNEHTGFPGTLMISKESLREVILAVARQVHAWGFRQVAVLNTHGGNTAVVTTTLREIRAGLGMRAVLLNPAVDFDTTPEEAACSMHAGDVETSWLMALAGPLVRPALSTCEYPARLGDPGRLRPERSAATYAWATRDVSRSGVIGDATAASPEKGARWLDRMATAYALAIDDFGRACRMAGTPPGA